MKYIEEQFTKITDGTLGEEETKRLLGGLVNLLTVSHKSILMYDNNQKDASDGDEKISFGLDKVKFMIDSLKSSIELLEDTLEDKADVHLKHGFFMDLAAIQVEALITTRTALFEVAQRAVDKHKYPLCTLIGVFKPTEGSAPHIQDRGSISR
jgi:hypothetical protein